MTRDAELVKQSLQNPENYGLIMNIYQEKLFWYIKRISFFENEEVEDLLQEIFIKIYQNLNSYDKDFKLSSWIYRIAHNHTIDAIRRQTVRPKKVIFNNEEILKLISDDQDLFNIIENKDLIKKIKQAIILLPLKYREVLILRYLEEKNYEEIMDILKKPKGSIATLINRGRSKLKKLLDQKNIHFK